MKQQKLKIPMENSISFALQRPLILLVLSKSINDYLYKFNSRECISKRFLPLLNTFLNEVTLHVTYDSCKVLDVGEYECCRISFEHVTQVDFLLVVIVESSDIVDSKKKG